MTLRLVPAFLGNALLLLLFIPIRSVGVLIRAESPVDSMLVTKPGDGLTFLVFPISNRMRR